VPIAVVWANVHGSFILLPVLLGIACIADLISRSEAVRWTAVLLAISLVSPAVSPWGFGTYRYVWDLARSPLVRAVITEWQPLWTRVPAFGAFLAVCAVTVGALVRHAHRRPTFEEAATLLIFTALAVWSQRNVLWWAVAAPPVVGGLLAAWQPGGAWSRVATRVAMVSLVMAVLIGTWHVVTVPVEDLRSEAPPGITAWLAAHPETDGKHVFAEWWGWWFEYAIPQVPMFVDARVELFPAAVWSDYGAIVDVTGGWQDVVARWNIDTIVIARGHHLALQDALNSNDEWSLAYQDAEGAIFTRR
jgi:uncharacterized protein (DUF486 family)